MKISNLPCTFYLGLLALLLTSCNKKGSADPKTDNQQDPQAAAVAANDRKEVLRHVVLFKFKDSSSVEDVKAIEEAFRKLPEQIEEILDFEWGTDASVENLSQGYTHCFLVTFKSEEERAIYLPHPAHKAFVDLIGPHLDKVLVLDYFSKG